MAKQDKTRQVKTNAPYFFVLFVERMRLCSGYFCLCKKKKFVLLCPEFFTSKHSSSTSIDFYFCLPSSRFLFSQMLPFSLFSPSQIFFFFPASTSLFLLFIIFLFTPLNFSFRFLCLFYLFMTNAINPIPFLCACDGTKTQRHRKLLMNCPNIYIQHKHTHKYFSKQKTSHWTTTTTKKYGKKKLWHFLKKI